MLLTRTQLVPGASQDVSSLTSVNIGLPTGVGEESDSASDIMWATNARGVWVLASVFANKGLYHV